MEKTSNRSPRFGTDYLFNWLSTPVKCPRADIERRLALAVFEHGEHQGHTEAFGYSRDDWRIERGSRIATLAFQNFAQREGEWPKQFAAYTLQATGRTGTLVHGVHERGYFLGTDVLIARKDTVRTGRANVLEHVDGLLQRRSVVVSLPAAKPDAVLA